MLRKVYKIEKVCPEREKKKEYKRERERKATKVETLAKIEKQ